MQELFMIYHAMLISYQSKLIFQYDHHIHQLIYQYVFLIHNHIYDNQENELLFNFNHIIIKMFLIFINNFLILIFLLM